MTENSDRVELKGMDRNNQVIYFKNIALYNWYEDIHDFDSDEFIKEKGIVRLEGKQFEKGRQESSFINHFDVDGRLIESIIYDAASKITKHEKISYDAKGKMMTKTVV